jgi:hypothetical protein
MAADAYNEPGAGEVCDRLFNIQIELFEDSMAALLEAITVKRKMYFEFENAPYYCLDAVTKLARLETGLEIKAPLYIQEGERVKVYTESGEFAGRA